MKGCSLYPDYDCEACLENGSCGLVMDEECHYICDQNIKNLKKRVAKNIAIPSILKNKYNVKITKEGSILIMNKRNV